VFGHACISLPEVGGVQMSTSDARRLHDTILDAILLTYAVISFLRSLAR